MPAELTTKQVAEELEIPLGTLKTWLSKIPVPANVDSAGNRRFNEEQIDIIRRIRALRLDDGRGMETIRRRLDLDEHEKAGIQPSHVPDAAEPSPERVPDAAGAQPQINTDSIVAAVVEAIAGQTALSERFGRIAHENGVLTERVSNLTAQLEEAKRTIAQLEAPKETPAPRPWWKVWG